MPTVQKYGGRKVATEPLPDVRRTAAETPQSMGVGVEQAKMGLAGAIGATGDTALQLGGKFAAIAIEERQKADLFAAFEADNKLARWTTKAAYDSDTGTGFRNIHGKDAQPLPEQVNAAFNKYADEVGATLKTQAQRDAYAKARANRGTDLDLQVRRHTDDEIQKLYVSELKATQENGINEAITLAANPDLVDKKLTEVIAALKIGGPKLLRMGPAELKAMIGETTTAIHAGVINRLIADGQDRNADAYYQHNKDAITSAATRTEIETKLQVGANLTLGLETANDLWRKFGPKDGPAGDNEPIAIDQMEAAANEKFKDDPKARRATIDFLHERKAGIDAARADRKEATGGALWAMVAKGATLQEITRSDAYLKAPGALQTQVKEHVIQEAQQEADRGYMLGQRTTAEATRQEQDKERNGWAMLWHYDDPKILGMMTDNQVLELTPSIGIDHVNRLMLKKRSLQTSEATVRAATIDDEDFKATAYAAGLPAYLTGADITPDQKAGLGRLRQQVETQIDREQQGTGKTLPRERRLAIMQAAVDQKVMLDVWGSDPETVAATVVNRRDRKAAYVPIATVKKRAPDFVKQAINLVLSKAEDPFLYKGMPDAELLVRLTPRIQHAYALFQMGATDAAVDRTILGDDDPEGTDAGP